MFVIGELINGMYKNVRDAIASKDKAIIQDLARKQLDAGADALDVNCGPASKDPVSTMKWLVEVIQEVTDAPLVLDSTKPNVIEEGLKLIRSKAIINSTTADHEKLEVLLPMATKYQTYLIGLTLDKKGVPQDKDRRLELAATIIAAAQEAEFPISDLYLDPIVLPVNVAQAQISHIIEAIHEFKILSDPAPKAVVGLSNVSQGGKLRSLINRTFVVMAQYAGLDAAILDPLDVELMDAVITAELILNKQIYCDSYIDAYRKSKAKG
jgi:5-methyltetrahydrofolate corrinoid/iron sulfur protein methyltransferase